VGKKNEIIGNFGNSLKENPKKSEKSKIRGEKFPHQWGKKKHCISDI